MKGYLTIKEVAEKWNVSVRWVQTLCATDKIDGAVKFGGVWAIPEGAKKPKDSRVTTGNYKSWRNMSQTPIKQLSKE